MKDPKEKEEQSEGLNTSADEREEPSQEDTNWSENQQIDEEGSEIDPDDVK